MIQAATAFSSTKQRQLVLVELFWNSCHRNYQKLAVFKQLQIQTAAADSATIVVDPQQEQLLLSINSVLIIQKS